MADKEHLLSDEEVQRFIVDGYTTVQAGFPTPLHDEICQKVDEVFEKEMSATTSCPGCPRSSWSSTIRPCGEL